MPHAHARVPVHAVVHVCARAFVSARMCRTLKSSHSGMQHDVDVKVAAMKEDLLRLQVQEGHPGIKDTLLARGLGETRVFFFPAMGSWNILVTGLPHVRSMPSRGFGEYLMCLKEGTGSWQKFRLPVRPAGRGLPCFVVRKISEGVQYFIS